MATYCGGLGKHRNMPDKTLVLGLGNTLLSDEGAVVHAVHVCKAP